MHLRRLACLALGALPMLAIASPAYANHRPFEIILNQKDREYRNTGTIVLRDPISDKELGRYTFATGGFKRGSAPFGDYIIGRFRSTNDDPLGIGPRWMLRQVGQKEDGASYDPKLKSRREDLELHHVHHSTGTQGCIGVLVGPDVWRQFMANLNHILSITPVVFTLAGNPNATDAMANSVPLEAVHYGHISHKERVHHQAHAHARQRHASHRHPYHHRHRHHR